MNSQLIVKNIKNLVKLCPTEKIQLYDQELVLVVKSQLLYDILLFFKYHISYQFNILTCITGVDYPNNKYRFKLVYDLLSIRYNIRLRIKHLLMNWLGLIPVINYILQVAGMSVKFEICTVFFLRIIQT